MCGIYKITNQLNGKVYIGQSNDIQRRWKEHKRPSKFLPSKTKLYEAFKEYGIENFSFEVLEECEEEQLNEKEKYYINKYNSIENGYNMSMKDNYISKLNKDIAEEIQERIKNTDDTLYQIAEDFNVSHALVIQIMIGEAWNNKKYSYPLREEGINYKINKCPHCGTIIGLRSKTCVECFQKYYNTKINNFDRNYIKSIVKNNTLSQASKDLDISVRTLKRWLEKLSLPITKGDINAYSDEEWALI